MFGETPDRTKEEKQAIYKKVRVLQKTKKFKPHPTKRSKYQVGKMKLCQN